MKKILYILLMSGAAFMTATLSSCSNDVYGDDNSHLLNFELMSDVDSAYTAFKQSMGRNVIPLANHLFYLLDTYETTDSLIQFAAAAEKNGVIANADYWMAEYLYQTNRQKEAMTLAHIALKQAEDISDKELQININSLLTAVYQRLGMFDDALRCLQICLDEDEQTGNKENMSSDLNNMAALFFSLKQYNKAKEQIDRAIEIEEKLGRENVLAIRYGIASEAYMLLDLLPEAEDFARKAYRLDLEAGRDAKAAIRLSQLASVLLKKGEMENARNILKQAIPILKNAGNTYSYIICENQLGDVFLSEKDYANAEAHYQAALELSEGNEYKYMKQRALAGLWRTLQNTDIARSAKYLEQYTDLTDTLHNEATERQLANMQAQFEYKELQAKNERLIYRSHISTLLWACGIIACILIITILSYIIYAKNKASIIDKQNEVMLNLIENGEQDENKELEAEKKNKEDKKSESDAGFINQFVVYVNNCITAGKPIDAADCASHLCVSPRHFSRKIMAITGSTPSAYINRIKINRAKRLLDSDPEMSITEISVKCGFEDLAYFGRVFRQIEGISPSQYKKRQEN